MAPSKLKRSASASAARSTAWYERSSSRSHAHTEDELPSSRISIPEESESIFPRYGSSRIVDEARLPCKAYAREENELLQGEVLIIIEYCRPKDTKKRDNAFLQVCL